MAATAALLAVEVSACGATGSSARPTTSTRGSPLVFGIQAGGLDNHFYQDGPIAVQVLTGSAPESRLLFAFPAGNTGAGLWFDEQLGLAVDGPVAPVERAGGLRGVSARVLFDARDIHVRAAVLGSLRAVREYTATGAVPAGFESSVRAEGRALRISRTMLDGRHAELTLEPEGDAALGVDASGRIEAWVPQGAGALVLRATALTDEEPLSPVPLGEQVGAAAGPDPQSRDALAFLVYREKLLAGAWRFLTYFGRDTLLTIDLLMPALEPAPIEAGLGSVLERLGPGGQVAHEESIGEWAVVENRLRGAKGDLRAPAYDYSMVDEDFLLAPALARYLAAPAGRERGAAFLAQRTSRGLLYRDAVIRNIDRVLSLAAPFASSPSASNLIALHAGTMVGDWRDSDNGLGGGRTPYDVNVAFVPAALEAAAQLMTEGQIGPDPERAERARTFAAAWREAPSLFRVTIPEADARARVAAYAESAGIDPGPALAAIDGPVEYPALALDAAGAPVPVLHSDVGFAWLYTDPPPEEVERAARCLFAPFPAGLSTPIGVIVANPAYAGDALRELFTPRDYHGTVVWSWQHAVLAAGIDRQRARPDLGEPAREALARASDALWDAIRRTNAMGMATAELWSFRARHGKIEFLPFGQVDGAADESNAAQLWSTVYLSVQQ